MKRFLSAVGFSAVALVSGVVVYLYVTDKEVKDKVDQAVHSVKNAANVIRRSIEISRLGQDGEMVDPVTRNQNQVHKQWEALQMDL